MFNGQSVADWLGENVVLILVVLLGLSILIAALNKKPRDAAITFGLGLLAMLFLAVGTQWREIGEWLKGIAG